MPLLYAFLQLFLLQSFVWNHSPPLSTCSSTQLFRSSMLFSFCFIRFFPYCSRKKITHTNSPFASLLRSLCKKNFRLNLSDSLGIQSFNNKSKLLFSQFLPNKTLPISHSYNSLSRCSRCLYGYSKGKQVQNQTWQQTSLKASLQTYNIIFKASYNNTDSPKLYDKK